MHIVCSGHRRPAGIGLAPVGPRAPWLMAVLRRPATAGLLRTGPVAAAFVDAIVDDARRAAPGAALEVTFHAVPDALVGRLVPRLLRLAGDGVDVRVACATHEGSPLRWRATAQPSDDDVSAWPPPAA